MPPTASIDGSQSGESGSGRGSPLTSQKVLDIIENSYPNPISIREICSTTQTDEPIVRQFVDELANKEKINSDDGQHYTRITKPIDTKVNLVKQMPKVTKSQQPVIAIITAQYCEKLAVDSMISDKETFVRYRTTIGQDNTTTGSGEPASANYVYTLGNIGDHRVVSTKLTSIGHSRGASIAAGNATTRLLGTFPGIEFVFLVGCGGGVVNYTDFSSHVRLGDVVVSHLPFAAPEYDSNTSRCQFNGNKLAAAAALSEYTYVHCWDKRQLEDAQNRRPTSGDQQQTIASGIPSSFSVHKNLKRAMMNGGSGENNDGDQSLGSKSNADKSVADQQLTTATKTTPTAVANSGKQPLIDYEDCNFRLWRPSKLDLQELTERLWRQGLENPKYRIWEYYIDEGIKSLKQQQDIDAARPAADTDKLFMSIGPKDTIEVSHPDAAEDEIDLRKDGRPMCHFGPVGSGRPAALSEQLKQQMISEFGLRAFDSEFDPVVESICGNCKESFIMIRGISDYKDGRKKKEWQQYSALVAAALMKSIIVNMKPLS